MSAEPEILRSPEPPDYSEWEWGEDVEDAFTALKQLMAKTVAETIVENLPNTLMVWLRQAIRNDGEEPELEVLFTADDFEKPPIGLRYQLVAWLTDQVESYVEFHGRGDDEGDPARIRLRALSNCLGSLHRRLEALMDDPDPMGFAKLPP